MSSLLITQPTPCSQLKHDFLRKACLHSPRRSFLPQFHSTVSFALMILISTCAIKNIFVPSFHRVLSIYHESRGRVCFVDYHINIYPGAQSWNTVVSNKYLLSEWMKVGQSMYSWDSNRGLAETCVVKWGWLPLRFICKDHLPAMPQTF